MNRFGDNYRTGLRSHLPRPLIVIGIVIACMLALGLTQVATVSTSEPANKETTHLFFDHLNGERVAPLQEFFTDDAAIHTSEGEFQGPGGADLFAATLREAFPTISFTTQQLESVDDIVMVRWSMVGGHYGDYQGQSASCAAVTANGVAILRFEDRMIDEQWIHYDRLAIVRQIELFNEIDPSWRPTCPNR